ncbi:hypothetical protein ACFY2H_42135 [Streptomyces griseofuscus]|uniref:hypothetical protein n=1 Tax=Streptomyces griseofuscus TaxID=146922 RepID=UPI0036BBCA10
MCGDIENLTGVGEEIQEQLEAAVRHARVWLIEQDEARRKLFDKLKRTVAEQKPGRVRRLLLRVNARASGNRTDTESAIYERATTYFDSLDDLTRDAVEAEADTEKEAHKAAARVRNTLQRLRGYDAYPPDLRPQVEELVRSAALAGELLTRGEARRVEVWQKRAARGPQEQLRVARRYWIQRSCPRCNAEQGKDCVLVEGPDSGKPRKDGHNERLQQAVDVAPPPPARAEPRPPRPHRREREPQETAGSASRTWHAREVTCPKCQAGPNSPCVPHGPHQERVEWAKEFTRKLWG